MARRVNTTFVIILGGILFAGAVVLVGALMIRSRMNNDPVRLTAQAEAEEKAGKKETAVLLYMRAAAASSAARMTDADKLYTKVGDLLMELSGTTTDPIKGSRYYEDAKREWAQALRENSRCLPAHEKLIEEQYKWAAFSPSGAAWTQLEESASKLVEVDPKYANGYAYLAAARMAIAMTASPTGDVDVSRLPGVEADLKKAMAMDASSSMPVILYARLLQVEGDLKTGLQLPDEAKKLNDEAMAVLRAYLAKNPYQADTVDWLARSLIRDKQKDAAVALLQAAAAAHPNDGRTVALLAGISMEKNLGQAEDLLKGLVAASPNDPESHLKLARFYQSLQRSSEAIESYKKVRQHPALGGGILVWQNLQRENDALYNISWLYMDIAEKKEVSTPEGAEAFTQAVTFADDLRRGQSTRGIIDLLDGRLQLIKNNLDSAITFLKRADVFFDADRSRQEWRNIKLLLAQAYDRKTEWGNELGYLEQFLKAYPRTASIVIRRAAVLNHEARFSEALGAIHVYANPGPEDKISPELRDSARRVEARAYLGLGNTDKYREVMTEIGGIDAMISVAANMMANGNLEGALKVIAGDPATPEKPGVLGLAPDNEKALALGIMLHLRLGADHKPEAQKLLERALAKYPNSPQFQFLKGRMDNPEVSSLDEQIKATLLITDPYVRNINLAQLYRLKNERDKALEAFGQAFQALQTNMSLEESHEQLSRICDQAFTLALESAKAAQATALQAADRAAKGATAADREGALKQKAASEGEAAELWKQAKAYAEKAESFNLDGAGGKLYQGRMVFAQGGGSRETGVSMLEQIVTAHDDNAMAHAVLGQAYYEMGRRDKSLAEFERAIQQKPDSLKALQYAIALLIDKGDAMSTARAASYLTLARQFAPRDPQLEAFGDIVGNPVEAIRAREEKLKSDPKDIENIRRLIVLYSKNKNPAKAAALLRPLYDQTPDDLAMANLLATLYREMHKYDDAKLVYEHFLVVKDPVLRYEATLLYGDFYRALAEYDSAIATYKNAAANEPAGRDDAAARLADLYFEIDDFADAEVLYRKLYDTPPKHNVRVSRRLGEVLIDEHKFPEADELLSGLLKDHPGDLDGEILRGYMLLKQKSGAKAIEVFNEVAKAHPDNADVLYYRAMAQYTMQGDLERASQDLLAVRAMGPDLIRNNHGNLLVNSRVLLARVYRLSRKYAESASEYDDIINTLSPNAPSLRVEYAQYLLVLAEVYNRIDPDNRDDFAQSIRSVKPAERLANLLNDSKQQMPGQPIWLMLEGDLLSLSPGVQARQDAQQRYAQAFSDSKENPQAASSYLASLLTSRDYQKVVDLTTRLLIAQPQYSDYYIKRGAAEAGLGNVQGALADYHKAMELAGGNVELYLAVAREAIRTLGGGKAIADDLQDRAGAGDKLAAIALAELLLVHDRGKEAIALLGPVLGDPKLQGERARVLRLVAMGKYQIKDFESASKDYVELLKITPDDIEALNNFAFMLADDMKKPKEALPYIERAVNILQHGKIDVAFVNNGNVYDTYGWVQYLSGDTAGSIVTIRKALEIEPIGLGYLHLSKALVKDGQMPEARKTLDRGIKFAKAQNDPSLKELETAVGDLH